MPEPMKVLSQRQVEKVLDDGEVHSVVAIGLTVGKYGPFQLDIPVDEYHEENVVALARDLEYRAVTIRYAIESLHERQPGQPEQPQPQPPQAT